MNNKLGYKNPARRAPSSLSGFNYATSTTLVSMAAALSLVRLFLAVGAFTVGAEARNQHRNPFEVRPHTLFQLC